MSKPVIFHPNPSSFLIIGLDKPDQLAEVVRRLNDYLGSRISGSSSTGGRMVPTGNQATVAPATNNH